MTDIFEIIPSLLSIVKAYTTTAREPSIYVTVSPYETFIKQYRPSDTTKLKQNKIRRTIRLIDCNILDYADCGQKTILIKLHFIKLK